MTCFKSRCTRHDIRETFPMTQLQFIASVTLRPRSAARFYESDCQGQFSSLLIAFSSFLLQSAHSDPQRTTRDVYGWAVQSCVADSRSLFSERSCEDDCKRGVDHREGVNHGSI